MNRNAVSGMVLTLICVGMAHAASVRVVPAPTPDSSSARATKAPPRLVVTGFENCAGPAGVVSDAALPVLPPRKPRATGGTRGGPPDYRLELHWSSAPNAFGASTFDYNGLTPCTLGNWVDNSEHAVRNSLSACGTPTRRYQDVTNGLIDSRRASVTCFNSWDGSTTDALAPGQYGERMHCVYRFYDANGGQVKLEYLKNIEIEYTYDGTTYCTFDPFNVTAPCDGFDFDNTFTFNGQRRTGFIGSTRITGGNPAVDEIVGSFGLAFVPDCCNSCSGQEQCSLNALLLDLSRYLTRFEAKMTVDDGVNPVVNESAVVDFESALRLEITDTCIENGQTQVTVQVWMRKLTQNVNGFQAFISFDDAKFDYNGAASSYTALPFPSHLQPILSANTATGLVRIDGATPPLNPGTNADSLLATLVFDVVGAGWAQCEDTFLSFTTFGPLMSELSLNGTPVATQLANSPCVKYDTVAPVISCPGTATIQCDVPPTPANTGGSATATDNCDPAPAISYSDSASLGGCDGTGTISRTWTATDACGNTSTCIQTINVVDTIAPSITCPANVTIECGESTLPANVGTATAMDNCDSMPMLSYTDSVAGSCPTIITRTWTATDACGNASSCDQTITVQDTTNPTITFCPPAITIQCSTPPTPANTGGPATASDVCDPSPAVTYTDVNSLGGCNGTGTITRTWKATDVCGNMATCVQVITVADTTPPTITSCPPNVTIECSDSTVPGIPFGSTTGGLMIYYNAGPEIPSNQAYYKAQVSYTNANGAPFTFSNLPLTGYGPLTWENLFVQVSSPPPFGFDVELVALTLMGPPPPPMLAYENTNNTAAGRMAAGPVLWKIGDYKDNAPNGPGNPANVDINSLFRSPSPGNPLTDVVLTQFTLTHPSANIWVAQIAGKLKADNLIHWYGVMPVIPDSPMAAFGLNGDIYFSGTLTYDTTLDTVNGQDFYAGTITFTANSPNAALGFALATDNCTLFPAISYTDVFTPGGACPPTTGTIMRTWKATDACGNMATCPQTITVVDTTAPVIACPANVTIECGDSTLPTNTGAATASDNCDASPAVGYSDSSAGSCPEVITRTWTATDACGNSSSCDQTITVQDTTAPTVTPPANQTVECDGAGNLAAFAAWQAGATASDVCSGPLPATYVQDSDVPGCGGTHVITAHWTATDACGNVGASVSRTFTIADTTPPMISCPADVSVNADPGGCSAIVAITPATGSDDCSGPVTISGVRSDMLPLTDPYPAGMTTITWTSTDGCLLTASCNQTVTVAAVNEFRIPVLLDGVALGSPVARCVRFILRDAGGCNVVSVSTNVAFSGGAPASGLATFTAACSNTGWLEVCGKDEQHTLSDKKPLTIAGGPPYYTCAPLLLLGGDTDNDNDVDINDVTLLLVQFGTFEGAGGCPWNGTRGSNFDLIGAVSASDYNLLSPNWLQFRNCCNAFGWPILGPSGPMDDSMDVARHTGTGEIARVSMAATELSPDAAAQADLNSDGVVDAADVEMFEARLGLPNDLSSRMRLRTQPVEAPEAMSGHGE